MRVAMAARVLAAMFPRRPLVHSAAQAEGCDRIRRPLTPELQKQRDDYVFEKTGRRPAPSGR
jgi:hypothetical protein